MLWSILMSAIPERFHLAQPLLYSLLEKQNVARMADVELLYLLDSRRRSVGAKRNVLLGAAQGQYIGYVDDDDMVADDYVSRIYDAIRGNLGVDVVCFGQRATIRPGGIIHECTYSLTNKTRELKSTTQPNVFAWSGPPAHTMVWRRGVNPAARFPEKTFGEDVEWCDAMSEAAKTEVQIPAVLYEYRFNQETSATR